MIYLFADEASFPELAGIVSGGTVSSQVAAGVSAFLSCVCLKNVCVDVCSQQFLVFEFRKLN